MFPRFSSFFRKVMSDQCWRSSCCTLLSDGKGNNINKPSYVGVRYLCLTNNHKTAGEMVFLSDIYMPRRRSCCCRFQYPPLGVGSNIISLAIRQCAAWSSTLSWGTLVTFPKEENLSWDTWPLPRHHDRGYGRPTHQPSPEVFPPTPTIVASRGHHSQFPTFQISKFPNSPPRAAGTKKR